MFGLAPTDAPTIATSVTLMIAVAGIAGYLPARRPARVHPPVALRYGSRQTMQLALRCGEPL